MDKDELIEQQAEALRQAHERIAELSRQQTEWLCKTCNTVFPNPDGLNISCKTPGCNGTLYPSSQTIRRLERCILEAEAVSESLYCDITTKQLALADAERRITELEAAQGAQEPVAWMLEYPDHAPAFTANKSDYVSWCSGKAIYPDNLKPLYAAPVLSQLSDAEMGHIDFEGMCEAFSRVIEAHQQKNSPFHQPVDADALLALRTLRGIIPKIRAILAAAGAKDRDGDRYRWLLQNHPSLINWSRSEDEIGAAIDAAIQKGAQQG